MAEREYFSLRYTVPGFAFMLIIVGMNYKPVFDILKGTSPSEYVLGVFLSFLSLFAGSAIGFLVAQFWYSYFHWRRIYHSLVFKRHETLMEKEFSFNSGIQGKDKDVTLSAILDYVLLSNEDEKYWKYCQRRWDIFHTLSCTLVSMMLGMITGLILRIILMTSFAEKGLGDLLSCATYQRLLEQFQTLSAESKTDVLLFAFTLVSAVTMILVMIYGRMQVFNEYHKILEILIKKKARNYDFKKELREVFPSFFAVKEDQD